MTITFDDLQALVKGEDLRFLVDPDRPVLHIAMGGSAGTINMVLILQDEGRFLQMRSVQLAACPREHERNDAVLRLLGELNYKTRLVKFAWDPADGEIVAYADLWVMDGTVTQAQFNRMMGNYVPSVAPARVHINAVLETGKDPGSGATLKSILAEGPGDDVPPELSDLLAKLSERAKKPEGDPISEI